MKKKHAFFENKECEFYPCHYVGQNCLFCFCPFYYLDSCKGKFKMLASGIKDCSGCHWIHDPTNYEEIINEIRNTNEKRRPLIKRIRDIQPKKSGGL